MPLTLAPPPTGGGDITEQDAPPGLPQDTLPASPPDRLATPQILHQDAACVILAKPAGMPTHPGRGCRDTQALLQWARDHLRQHVYPVHRLDRATSGLVVFALSPAAAAAFGTLVRQGGFDKTYHALVRGWPAPAGCIEKPLHKLAGFGATDAPPSMAADALPARTHYRTLQRWELPWSVRPYATSRYSLVELRPETGRTHQLRRHLHSLSHPILGDTRYGDGAHNSALRRHLACHQLLLQAQALSFIHPWTGARVDCAATYDAVWTRVLAAFAAAPPGPA